MNGHRKASAPSPGFLGSTSSSADYIGVQRQRGFREVAEDDDLASDGNAELFPIYPEHQIDAGAAILDHFLEFPFIESFIHDERLNSCGVTLISPWLTYVGDSIRKDIHEPLLQSSEQHGDHSLQHGRILEHLSRRLFRNTSTTLDYDGCYSLEQYASLFTGQNLRWEAVGIFFAGVGLGAINVRRYVRSQSGGDMNF